MSLNKFKDPFPHKQFELQAISSLLDCSNTKVFKKPLPKRYHEDENLCPWIHPKKFDSSQTPKQRRKASLYCLLKRVKKPMRIALKAVDSTLRTDCNTPKGTKPIPNFQITNKQLNKNIVNLNRQFQLIHNRRRNQYILNQLNIRLKTQ